MGWKTTLGLMIAFMVLGSFAFFDPLHLKEKEEYSKAREDRLLWLKGQKLESISLKFSDNEIFMACKKTEGCDLDATGDWKLTKPIEEEGDPSAIGTLASSILNLSPSEKLDFKDKSELSEFGLDKPKIVIHMMLKGNSIPKVLTLGANATYGNNTYALSSEKEGAVFLVPTFFTSQVKSDPFHWRNKRVFGSLESSDVRAIDWSGSFSAAAKKVGPKWTLEKPVQGRANQMMLEGLTSGLSHLEAKGILESDLAKKLGKPKITIHLETLKTKLRAEVFERPKAEGASHALEYVFKSDQNPIPYLVESAFFERFSKSLMEYRYRNIFDPDLRYTQRKIALTFPREKKKVLFTNEGGIWKYTEGDKLDEQYAEKRVRAFFDALFLKEANEFLNPIDAKKQLGGKTPDLIVEISDGLQSTLRVSAFVDTKTEAKLKIDGEQELLVFGVDFLKVLPARLSDLGESANRMMNVLPKPGK